MKGKSVKYTVAIAVLASMMQTTPAFANPVSTPVSQVQINDLETKIQKLDNQIIEGMDKIQQLNDNINAQQGKIEKSKAEIEKAKNDFETHKKIYTKRLRSIQSEGQQPVIAYAELLLSSDNISQFLNRSTAISQVLQSDTDLLKGLNEKEQALKDAQQQLQNELDNLEKNRVNLAAEQKKIEADKQKIEKELSDDKKALQQQAQDAQLAQQRNLISQTSAVKNTPATIPAANLTYSSDKAAAVIAYAEQYLGVPYVWGGTSPSGFDCSGFTQYVFRSVGVSLSRTARGQQDSGIQISPSAVQPGDLVFQGNPAYHVGIYIGGGKYIHSPETGDVVKIASYDPSRFSTASRVLR